MAFIPLNRSRLDQFGGIDEIVANQRVRAYVPGDPVASGGASTGGGLEFGTMWMFGTGVPTSVASGAGAQTLTAAILGGGIIVHNLGPNTNVTDTTDTAANIYTYMVNNSAGVAIGDILVVELITNSGSGTSVLTITPGSGVTLDANAVGTLAAGISKSMYFRCTATSTPAFTLYM